MISLKCCFTMYFLVKLLLIALLLLECNGNKYLIPSEILTELGSSFTVQMNIEGITAEECYIVDGKNKYIIDLFQPGLEAKPEADLREKPKYTDIITSLGYGICGFKIDNISENYTTEWNITTVHRNGSTYSDKLQVIKRPIYVDQIKTKVKVGGEIRVYCNKTYSDSKLNYCTVHNPKDELVKWNRQDCYFYKNLTTMSDFGIWKCRLSYISSMDEKVISYEFIPIDYDIIQSWQNETEFSVNFGCSITNSSKKHDYCIMVRPDGKQFTLRPGLATKRYTVIGTDPPGAVCSMQIAKPLEDSDRGLWRCEFHDNENEPIGAFINVSRRDNYTAEPDIPKEIITHVSKSFSAQCRVPYSAPYCYMRGPDGFIYPIRDDRAVTLGLCKFHKEEAQLTDNGTWFCGFGKTTGEPDDIYTFQVHIQEVIHIQPEVQTIEARKASSSVLKCSTKGLGDYPLKYCRFLSPDAKMYHIENRGTSDRISYEGRGTEYGDCGIRIHDVEKSDEGTWSCITRIGVNFHEDEIYTNIHLNIDDNLSLASVLGITFGTLIVTGGLGTIGILRWRRRRSFTDVDADNPFSAVSDAIGNGDENIILDVSERVSVNRNYNTLSSTLAAQTDNT